MFQMMYDVYWTTLFIAISIGKVLFIDFLFFATLFKVFREWKVYKIVIHYSICQS